MLDHINEGLTLFISRLPAVIRRRLALAMVSIATDCSTDLIVIQDPVRTTGRGFLMRRTGESTGSILCVGFYPAECHY